MENFLIGIVLVPGAFALLLFTVFTYLHGQTRESHLRAWQAAFAAYLLHSVFLGLHASGYRHPVLLVLSRLLLGAFAWCAFASVRLMHEPFRIYRHDLALAAVLLAVSFWRTGAHPGELGRSALELPEVAAAVLLISTGFRFARVAHQRDSLGFRLLWYALVFWGVVLGVRSNLLLHPALATVGYVLAPLPQLLVGIAMVMVLFETERRTVHENALAFSTLDAESAGLLAPTDLVPSLERLLQRLAGLTHCEQAAICIAERWRAILPSVQRGFSLDFLSRLESHGAGEYLSEMAYRRGGLAVLPNVPHMREAMPAGPSSRFRHFQEVMAQEKVGAVTAVSLQTRERNFGVVLFPHRGGHRGLGSTQVRLLLGAAMQIGMTLENYVLMHDAKRRTKEYELLTQMGQVISSRLDADEVLRAIHAELGLLFDTSNFSIAFLDKDVVRFEFEVINGVPQPKRSRQPSNGLTEYVIRTGQPLLIRSEVQQARARLGCACHAERMEKCYIGVPIFMSGRPAGVMAALNLEREFAYDERDLNVLQTAAGQVAVAVENARLFAEEQRRARYLGFLNSVSKTAISSQDEEEMLAEIVGEVQKNFNFDHIGIGVLDYNTKEIEIKAEAGTTAHGAGKRVPLGVGILGRVARTNETALVQNSTDGGHLLGILPDSRSVLCIPITYGETLLGVLNIESLRENAFAQQEVLILRTLADLLATALHNALIFQRLQKQSITDGLTGIKTRRFFMESVQSEWKRASRSGRPFSVVLIDLDRFKDVNDSMGHLEGDLVLARVGRLLEQKSRQSNVVARYGGDEFVILMPETGAEQAHILSERLRLWIANDPTLADRNVTASFGVATYPIHGGSVDEVIRVADGAMYVSKHAGGNRVSAVEEDGAAVAAMMHNQQLLAYVEGFLQREESGPEYIDELVSTLLRLCSPQGTLDSDLLLDAIKTLNRASEAREEGGSGHGEHVARFAGMLGRELGVVSDELADITFAALVHDIGKILVPEKILNKQGLLSDREYRILRMHSEIGAKIIGALPGMERPSVFVRHHHERVDGSGYPNGLAGDEIPLGARIIGMADAYVSMMSEHAFAPAKNEAEVIRELETHSGSQFDRKLVRILTATLRGERTAKAGT